MIIEFLLLSCLTCVINFSSYKSENRETCTLDCLPSNADYIDPNTLYDLTSDDTPYSSKINSYADFKTSYFDNLTTNFGFNYKGSCGYVAIGMLLSYYDTYLNDDIIPENYDINSTGESKNMINRRNSPGILRDYLTNSSDYSDFDYGYQLSASEYYSKMEAISNVSLHSKLITIGAAKGYYDFENNFSPCATNFDMRYNIMEDYFSTILNYTYGVDYTYSYVNGESSSTKSESVRDFAIAEVKKGNPVLLSMGNAYSGHVAVAYDYDEEKDELYCNMGWNASTTHQTIEKCSQEYNRYKTALAINFRTSHSHTNNYAVTTISNDIPSTNKYCYHECGIKTYDGGDSHSYTDNYGEYNSKKHICYCACGAFEIGYHVVSTTYKIGTHYYGKCVICGLTVDLGTKIVIVASEDEESYLWSSLNEFSVSILSYKSKKECLLSEDFGGY